MICDAALEIIKRNEGCVLHTYLDVVGVPTIGYGLTGPEASPGRVITQAQADAFLVKAIEEFEGVVREVVRDGAATENQIGAMVSLAYNIGASAFRRSTVLRRHNERSYHTAADAFLMWNKAGGRELSGLTRRRHEERALYLSNVPAVSTTPAPTYDRYKIAKAIQVALGVTADGIWGPVSRAAYEKFNRGT